MLSPSDNLSDRSSAGTPPKKIALKKGRGLMDWVRLGNSAADLAGTKGKILKVTPEELAKHNKKDDAWIALKGNVYNVTPYFEFHPGGEDELMRGAGIDATALFNEIHKWVNFQSMLKKCFVGPLVESRPFFSKPSFLPKFSLNRNSASKTENSFLSPQSSSSISITSASPTVLTRLPSETSDTKVMVVPENIPAYPKYDWFQTKNIIDIAIYTKCKEINDASRVIVINQPPEFLKILAYIRDHVYSLHLKLSYLVEDAVKLKTANGKIDVLLNKAQTDLRWTSLGKELDGNNQLVPLKDKKVEYLNLEVAELSNMTHNTFLLKFEIPENIHFNVPIGYHVYLRHKNSDVVKPYTPVVTPLEVSDSQEKSSEKSNRLEIFFKVYPDGALTPLLRKLSVGDEVEVSLPEGTFPFERLQRPPSHLVLLGAGTGVTPHVRLLMEALTRNIKTTLLLFNQTEEDIPWAQEWERLTSFHGDLLKVYQILSKPSDEWTGLRGRVRRDLLEELRIAPTDPDISPFACVCGTTGFTELSVSLLEEIGYSKDNIWAFTG